MFDTPPQNIYWCYSEYKDAYRDLDPAIQLMEGLPSMKLIRASKDIPKLIILDDLMEQFKARPELTQLFTKYSHHNSLSVIFLVQNLFYEGLRTARLNCKYICLFKNPGDRLHIQNLAKQMFPQKSKFLVDAFNDATEGQYGYLFLDLHPETPEKQRYCTNIFPLEMTVYYVPVQS